MRLTQLLRRAYSGELAAALAYDGHAASVRDPVERREIAAIAEEERAHRRRLGEMLRELGTAPDPGCERRARRIGTLIARLCRHAGWFLPMYVAGQLEGRNSREYEGGARIATEAGRPGWAEELLEMARAESRHEKYFREKADSRRT